MKVYVDIDETICSKVTDGNYAVAEPIYKNIDLVNKLYDEGHEIVYWTARGSNTGMDWRDVTESQLNQWGCKRHEIRLGKPAYDVLIDDKVINSRLWEKFGNEAVKNVYRLQQSDFADKPKPPVLVSKLGNSIQFKDQE